jgi:hypothetical protein
VESEGCAMAHLLGPVSETRRTVATPQPPGPGGSPAVALTSGSPIAMASVRGIGAGKASKSTTHRSALTASAISAQGRGEGVRQKLHLSLLVRFLRPARCCSSAGADGGLRRARRLSRASIGREAAIRSIFSLTKKPTSRYTNPFAEARKVPSACKTCSMAAGHALPKLESACTTIVVAH